MSTGVMPGKVCFRVFYYVMRMKNERGANLHYLWHKGVQICPEGGAYLLGKGVQICPTEKYRYK